MATSNRITRRGLLASAAGAVAAGTAGMASAQEKTRQPNRGQRQGARRPRIKKWDGEKVVTKGRINQSVCDWCFIGDCSVKPITLDELCKNAAAMGIKSVELAAPDTWETLKKHGLVNALAPSHGFEKGFNDKANHEMCIEEIKKSVDACAAAGFPAVITFSGFRENIPDDVGLENSVEGLKKVIGYAEKNKINLILEVLNSRVEVEMKGHPGYMGDSVEWCVEVCKRVGSERMKILFDIYHVQIMQGDIITRIKENQEYIGHYHTAGVPGRNELGSQQEVNYPPIMRTIVETGYTGYVAQEFIPTKDPMTSLAQAVQLCDV
jgi:hydroxypyruvate isomerase